MLDYVPTEGAIAQAVETISSWEFPVVIKPNRGTSGRDIYFADAMFEVEFALLNILTGRDAAAASPWVDIEREIRCICFRQQVEITYEKLRSCVVGNGVSSVQELAIAAGHDPCCLSFSARHSVPKSGEKIYLQRRHNLSSGAEPVPIESKTVSELEQLVGSAANLLRLEFGAIDVVSTPSGFRILEVNSGIMLKNFAGHSTENESLCEELYEKVFTDVFF